MRKLFLGALALMIGATGFAQKTFNSYQIGNNNQAFVYQDARSSGDSNFVNAWQSGDRNILESNQFGRANYMDLRQSGDDNIADMNQTGRYNYSEIRQTGDDNIATLNQTGHYDRSYSWQSNNGNTLTVNQAGPSYSDQIAESRQNGLRTNNTTINQVSFGRQLVNSWQRGGSDGDVVRVNQMDF